jgi:hypothetical protein
MKKCAMNSAENGPIRNFTIRRSRNIPRFQAGRRVSMCQARAVSML